MFIGLVLVHEWGHYLVARRNGVDVEEFGLGFPPRAWGKKLKGGMLLSLNWLPLGGFVKLKGENDADKRKGSFGSASLGAKTRILLAGVGMNLLVGLIILTVLAITGMPKLLNEEVTGQDQFKVANDTKIIRQEVRVGQVQANSPASKIGLVTKDTVLSIGRAGDVHTVSTQKELSAATRHFAGQEVNIKYKHLNNTLNKKVTLRSEAEVNASLKTNDPKGNLGVSDPVEIQVRRSTWSAPIVAVGFTGQLVELTFKGLGHALGGLGSLVAGAVTGNHAARENGQTAASSQVGGPVAIMAILWGSGSLGLSFLLMFIAIISLTLALMNVLPIPALDGGRLAMILTARGLFKKPLNQALEERLVAGGMIVLMGLVLVITVVDVKRFL